MAQYDGSIRINTKIDTQNASVQLRTLENRTEKTADKIAGLRSKLESLKTVRIPTDEYKTVQAQIDATEKKISDLLARQEKFLATGGKESSTTYKRMQYDLDELRNSLPYLKSELQDLIDSGEAFTLGNPEEIAKTEKELQYAENDMSVLNLRHDELVAKQREASNGYKKLGDAAKKSFLKIKSMLGSTDKSFKSLNMGLKNILKYGFGIRSLYVLFNKLRSSISEGYSNLYNDNERFRRSIDSLKASASTLKNSLAAAFRPLVDIAIPYIQKVIDYMSILLNSVGQFLAAITGQKAYTRAIKQTATAIEDQNKAQNKQLSNLDKLNNLTSDSGSSDSGGSGQLFEEVPVNSYFTDIAGKVKDVLSKLFAPLKEAWNREGKFVMDSWKYALDEVWRLIKDIGRDFLTVWQQEGTITIFQDILHIIGDIGLVVGNLSRNFREAWNENEVGLHILENIRDIIGIIVSHIRGAADATVEWADKLDFTPLLESVNGLLEALKPITDNIGAGLEWFYTNVLLPIAGWTITDLIPTFLDMLSAAIGALNEVLEALKPVGQWFWDEFLQPLGKWTGDAIISAMETVAELFEKFGNWISEHKDGVAQFVEILGLLAAGFAIVKGAAFLFGTVLPILASGIKAVIAVLTGPIGIIAALAALVVATGHGKDMIESLKKILGGLVDFVAGVFTLDWKRAWDGIVSIFKGIAGVISGIVNSIVDGIEWVLEKIGVLNRAKEGTSMGSIGGAVSGAGSIRPRASSYSLYPDIQDVEFPGYASGQVIPTSMKKHLAWLGDNNRETEVVSPLSTIEQAVISAMAKVNGGNGNNGGGSVTIEIPVILNDREVGRAIQQFDREYFKQTGKHAFA